MSVLFNQNTNNRAEVFKTGQSGTDGSSAPALVFRNAVEPPQSPASYGRPAQGSGVLCALTGHFVSVRRLSPPRFALRKGAVHFTRCAAPALSRNTERPSATRIVLVTKRGGAMETLTEQNLGLGVKCPHADARGFPMTDKKPNMLDQQGERAKKPSHKLEPGNPEGQHPAQHTEASSNAPPPKEQRELTRENQSGKGSGEGTTGMQRGAGHPTGR